MTEKTMTTTTDVPQTYLISNAHLNLARRGAYDENAGCTWVLFVEGQVIESGFDKPDVSLIEIYKYIDGSDALAIAVGLSATQTSSRVVGVLEARAEWNFWIGQGFQRITNTTDKGWKYTEELQQRTGIEKMASGIKIKPIEKEDDSKKEIIQLG